MKRRTFIKSCSAGALVLMTPVHGLRIWAGQASSDLERGFLSPPDSAKPRVWWHWVDENVTKEGITRDLEWMHRVGIGGFQMFDTGFNVKPFVEKPIKFRSPEWYEMLRHAASEAKRLGLEMAMHSDSGSSTTGGTWVKPEEAMKKYVWSELYLQGPVKYIGKLPHPPTVNGGFQNTQSSGGMSFGTPAPAAEPDPTYYADSAVIAYRLPDSEVRMADRSPKATTNAGAIDASPLFNGDLSTSINIPATANKTPSWIQFEFKSPFTSRALTIAGSSPSEIKVSDDGIVFRTLTTLGSQGFGGFGRRTNSTTTYSFPETKARFYRVEFEEAAVGGMRGMPGGIPGGMGQGRAGGFAVSELEFHSGGRVHHWEDKAYFGSLYNFDTIPTPPVAAEAVVSKANVIDVTSKMAPDGTLVWDVPEGKWIIMRLGYSLEGTKNHPAVSSAEGYECDKLSAKYVETYMKEYLEPVAKALGPLYGTSFKYILVDSWEAGALNWTDEMLKEFSRRRGYDPFPYLPVLTGRVIESADVSDRFLWDYRRTISDMIADNHYGVIADYLHKNGLGFYSEAAGLGLPTLEDGLLNKGKTDIPMGEFWMQYPARKLRDEDEADVREAACAAHVYGKNIVAAESFTTAELIAWKQAPSYLKWGADYIMSVGLNRFIIHTSVHQPMEKKPGMTLHVAGQHFSRHSTWAEMVGPFIEYMARGSYMLQQGKYVADICYYYGESTPVTVPATKEINPEPPEGYRYDFINAELLLTNMTVENGRLTLPGGMAYKILALPADSIRMTPEVAKKIRDLVRAGATILGPKPDMSPSLKKYPQCDKDVKAIADELWADLDGKAKTSRVYGRGKVVWGKSLKDVLADASIQEDLRYIGDQKDSSLVWIHRRMDDVEIYFLASQMELPGKFSVSFRINDKSPELWHPDSGKIEPAEYAIINGRTEVALPLDPFGSVFVVFREKANASVRKLPGAIEQQIASIEGPWDVSFAKGWGAPISIRLDKLISWTQHPDDGVKHYSGIGIYIKEFEAPDAWFKDGGNIVLDLGTVKEIAEVVLNGTNLGVVWKPPFSVDVTGALKNGKNRLEIKVANTWLNRLIGDAGQPENKRYTFAFALHTSANVEDDYKNAELMESGLIGPVTIKSITAD